MNSNKHITCIKQMVEHFIYLKNMAAKIKHNIAKWYELTIDFNEHNIDIFINDTWQKYVGDSSELQVDLKFAFDQ